MASSYLFTPGPTPVPPQVLAALAEPVVHHRSPDFRPVYERCLTRLREVCRTEQDVLLFTASGTGAFESAVAEPRVAGRAAPRRLGGQLRRALGRRWRQAYGAEVDQLAIRLGRDARPRRRARAAARARGEGGVDRPFRDVDRRRRRHPGARRGGEGEPARSSVVDAVSSLGAVPLRDGRVGPRRRRLRLAEGADDPARARRCAPSRRRPARATGDDAALLLRLGAHAQGAGRSSTQRSRRPSRSSPALDVALGLLLEEGLEACSSGTSASAARAARARRRWASSSSRRTRTAAPSSPPCGRPTASTRDDVVKRLRDRTGSRSRAGRASLKGKIFRLGHIGLFDVFDITTALAAVELAARRARRGDRARRRRDRALEAYEHAPVA